MKEKEIDSGCKCPACLETEGDGRLPGLPYRQAPDRGLTIIHLVLHASLPILGVFLIGPSWFAIVPILGSAAAYLANSFILCPTCAYHHAGVRFCGCYPKSIFPYRRYLGKRWGVLENVVGRSSVLLFTLLPSIAVLAARGQGGRAIAVLILAVVAIFATSVVVCPMCRQREVCALGKLAAAAIERDRQAKGML